MGQWANGPESCGPTWDPPRKKKKKKRKDRKWRMPVLGFSSELVQFQQL